MDVERIERALRDGPPAEPVYVPGAFRRRGPSRGLLFAMAGGLVVLALAVGIGVGIGLNILRGEGVGTDGPPVVVAADLQGAWTSDPISYERWVDAMQSSGFAPADIGEFLLHDPFEERVRYGLVFTDDQLTIRAAYDDRPMQMLSGGTYTLIDGLLRYREVVENPPDIGGVCEIAARLSLQGDRLTMDIIDMGGCGLDARMAHTAFFEMSSFTR